MFRVSHCAGALGAKSTVTQGLRSTLDLTFAGLQGSVDSFFGGLWGLGFRV